MRRILAGLALALWPTVALAQNVIVTEVEFNPTNTQNGEWIELQNVGTASVSLGGWSLVDYVASEPGREATTRWLFPMTASIAAGRVIVVAKQAVGTAFLEEHGRRPTWEMITGAADDPMTPNLMPMGGTDQIALSNANTGDAVVLRDGAGVVVSGVEWGSVDRTFPGTPLPVRSDDLMPGRSLTRIAMTGSSSRDFQVTSTPNPFVGFGAAAAPNITSATARPPHVTFNDTFTVTASVTDSDGVRLVEVYLATATASVGDAATQYSGFAMTATRANGYRFSAPVENLGPGLGFGEPASFHERYVRWFISANDTITSTATDPPNADEDRTNRAYRQKNVMPRMPVSIADVRAQNPNGVATWLNHSVRVRGVIVVAPYTFSRDRGDFMMTDASGRGIAIFDPNGDIDRLMTGAVVEVLGQVGQFNGLTQIQGPGLEVKDVGMMQQVPQMTLTIAQVLAMAESLESTIVEIKDVSFMEANRTMWPGMGTGGNVTITDGTGMMDLRVYSGTDLFNTAAPRYGFDVKGVIGQFDSSSPHTTGYQIQPRGMADIVAKPMPPPVDSGLPPGADAGPRADATTRTDSGITVRTDGGSGGSEEPAEDSGCSCSTQQSDPASGLFAIASVLFLALAMRRRR